ncbi:MAG TPA: hypothetical protein PL110_20560 [Candidatus Eremiobacteraeota bacterium]|nr:MAG: hypothetical protein BWY64_00009 [bacterium ADurb.Bin363]HPZ10494.1 hypothetical protein [Candidatus Eremiobacteraeota bacterium]
MRKRLIIVIILLAGFTFVWADPVDIYFRVSLLEELLHKQVHKWILEEDLARSDGYIYTVDIGQIMIYFALKGNLKGYSTLRDFAVENIIVNDPGKPFTRGFVAWRYRKGEKLDATGTTESLRIAKALWLGSQSFNRSEDREIALLILDGYCRHSGIDQGIWFIKNYYNFTTNSFATNSFTVDYDPDFLMEVADKTDHPVFKDVAIKSYELFKDGVSPSGLFYDIIQPEVKTLFPDLNMKVFSPNDIIQLSNSCNIADTIIKGDPEIALKTLNFSISQKKLYRYYYGRTGEPVTDTKAALSEYTALVELSSGLNNIKAQKDFLELVLPMWKGFYKKPYNPKLYTASEILLAIYALKEK